MLKRFLVPVVFLAVLFSAGCGKTEDGRPVVVTGIVPQQVLAERIAGDTLRVVSAVPPGYSPANYQLSPAERADISSAVLYITAGVPAEDVIRQDLGEDLLIYDIWQDVDKVFEPRYFSGGSRDPHMWLSPSRYILMAELMAAKFAYMFPENGDIYIENCRQVVAEVEELDGEIREMLSGSAGKAVVVYHPAFGYFTDEYGMEMIALEKEGKEPGPRDMAEVLEKARALDIKAVIYQQEISGKEAAVLAEELGGKEIMIDPLSADYESMLRRTAEVFRESSR